MIESKLLNHKPIDTAGQRPLECPDTAHTARRIRTENRPVLKTSVKSGESGYYLQENLGKAIGTGPVPAEEMLGKRKMAHSFTYFSHSYQLMIFNVRMQTLAL